MPLTPPPSRIGRRPGGRDGREAELGGQLHPLALADRRRFLRVPVHPLPGAAEVAIGLTSCLARERERRRHVATERLVPQGRDAVALGACGVAQEGLQARQHRRQHADRADGEQDDVGIDLEALDRVALSLADRGERARADQRREDHDRTSHGRRVRHQPVAVLGRRDPTVPRRVELLHRVVPRRTSGPCPVSSCVSGSMPMPSSSPARRSRPFRTDIVTGRGSRWMGRSGDRGGPAFGLRRWCGSRVRDAEEPEDGGAGSGRTGQRETVDPGAPGGCAG